MLQCTSYIISCMVYDISLELNIVDIWVSAAFCYLLLQDILKMAIFTIASASPFLILETYAKIFNNSIIRFRCSFSRAFHIIKNYWNIIFKFLDIHTFIYFLPYSTLIVVKFTYNIHYFYFIIPFILKFN